MPPLRPSRGRAVALPGLRVGVDRAARHRDRAAVGRAVGRRAGVPAGRDVRDPGAVLARVRGRAARDPRRHADGREGPRLPRRRSRRRRRRRRDAALPRLPRRGADVRARRRSSRAGPAAARRAAGCSSRRSRPTPGRSRWPRSTTRTRSWPASSSGGARCATRRSRRSCGSSARRGAGRGRRARPRAARAARALDGARPAGAAARPGAAVPAARPGAQPGRRQGDGPPAPRWRRSTRRCRRSRPTGVAGRELQRGRGPAVAAPAARAPLRVAPGMGARGGRRR